MLAPGRVGLSLQTITLLLTGAAGRADKRGSTSRVASSEEIARAESRSVLEFTNWSFAATSFDCIWQKLQSARPIGED